MSASPRSVPLSRTKRLHGHKQVRIPKKGAVNGTKQSDNAGCVLPAISEIVRGFGCRTPLTNTLWVVSRKKETRSTRKSQTQPKETEQVEQQRSTTSLQTMTRRVRSLPPASCLQRLHRMISNVGVTEKRPTQSSQMTAWRQTSSHPQEKEQ